MYPSLTLGHPLHVQAAPVYESQPTDVRRELHPSRIGIAVDGCHVDRGRRARRVHEQPRDEAMPLQRARPFVFDEHPRGPSPSIGRPRECQDTTDVLKRGEERPLTSDDIEIFDRRRALAQETPGDGQIIESRKSGQSVESGGTATAVNATRLPLGEALNEAFDTSEATVSTAVIVSDW
jgi:hypothetical protein